MRWDDLFADLEGQLAAAGQLDHESAVAELVRAEQAALGLADRLRGHGGAPVDLLLACGVRFRGTVRQVAETWIMLEAPPHSAVVPLGSIVTVTGLGRRSRTEPSSVRRSLSLASALRTLARDRALVTCYLASGSGEPHSVAGTIDTVGSDYLEVAARGGEAGRGADAVAIPFAALIAVRSGG